MNVRLECFIANVEQITGHKAQRSGEGVKLFCPAHEGHSPALSIGEAPDGTPLVHCHAGCDSEAVLGRVGWKWADFHEGEPTSPPAPRHAAPRSTKPPDPAPSPSPQTFDKLCEVRRLDKERLVTRWRVQETVHKGRPCLRYPTVLRVDRVKYLDGAKPKYEWAARGGKAHWYGMGAAKGHGGPVLYIVNGELSAWGADQKSVPAVCPCGEKVKISPAMLEDLKGSGFTAFKMVFDRDNAGRDGARKRWPPSKARALAPWPSNCLKPSETRPTLTTCTGAKARTFGSPSKPCLHCPSRRPPDSVRERHEASKAKRYFSKTWNHGIKRLTARLCSTRSPRPFCFS